MKRSIFILVLSLALTTLIVTSVNTPLAAVEVPPLFVIITHGGEGNVFWAGVYLGMKAAGEMLGVRTEMFRPVTEGDLDAQLTFFKAVLARRPAGIATTVPHPTMFDSPVQLALDMGIPVIAVNTDDPEAGAGNARLAYIGQDKLVAGYLLAKAASKHFPDDPSVMIGVEGPGLVWAVKRKTGIIQFLNEQGITDIRIQELTFDFAVAESLIVAHLLAHPRTNVILTVGTATAPAAWAAAKVGRAPGEIVIGGFDLIPEILEQIKAGYVTLTIDQQPFLQGFLSVVQLALMNRYGFSAWDVDTGMGIVDITNVHLVYALAKERIR